MYLNTITMMMMIMMIMIMIMMACKYKSNITNLYYCLYLNTCKNMLSQNCRYSYMILYLNNYYYKSL